MKCKRCGNTVLPNQVFCNRCGAPIEDDGKGSKSSLFDDETVEKNKKSKFIIILSILAAAIIILLILLLILNGKDKTNTNNNPENTEVTTHVTDVGDYYITLPEAYTKSAEQGNETSIYDEQDNLLGEIVIKEETYAKAVNNANQKIQSKVKGNNSQNFKYSIDPQEKKKINDLDCTVCKIKCTDRTTANVKTYIFYVTVAKVSETTSALIVSAPDADETKSYANVEKLISIVKTIKKDR